MNEVKSELAIKIQNLNREYDEVISDIENFDVENRPVIEFQQLFEVIEQLKVKVEDTINEMEVDDFLMNGSRMKNKNI